MIKFYGYNTINSLKVLLFLLETKHDYEFIPINIRAGEQRQPEFLSINPAGKVPVILDGDFLLTESNAILLYLTKKVGWGLDGTGEIDRINEWLFYQSSSQGPYFGQIEYWANIAKTPNPEALSFYTSIAKRSVDYINDRLKNREYICGDTYSIADIALFPWLNDHNHLDLDLDDAPNVLRWIKQIRSRPATSQACAFFEKSALFQAKH